MRRVLFLAAPFCEMAARGPGAGLPYSPCVRMASTAAGSGVQPEAVAGRVDDLLHLQARVAAHKERGEALASRALSASQKQQGNRTSRKLPVYACGSIDIIVTQACVHAPAPRALASDNAAACRRRVQCPPPTVLYRPLLRGLYLRDPCGAVNVVGPWRCGDVAKAVPACGQCGRKSYGKPGTVCSCLEGECDGTAEIVWQSKNDPLATHICRCAHARLGSRSGSAASASP